MFPRALLAAFRIPNQPSYQPHLARQIVESQFCRSRSMMLAFAIPRYRSAGIAMVSKSKNGYTASSGQKMNRYVKNQIPPAMALSLIHI